MSTGIDFAKARTALAAARAYPEYHAQGSWVKSRQWQIPGNSFPVAADNGEHPPCGTTMCFAGWVAFLFAPKGSVIDVNNCWVISPYHLGTRIEEFARNELHLSWRQHFALFHQARTADDIDAVLSLLEREPDAYNSEVEEAIGR